MRYRRNTRRKDGDRKPNSRHWTPRQVVRSARRRVADKLDEQDQQALDPDRWDCSMCPKDPRERLQPCPWKHCPYLDLLWQDEVWEDETR